MDPQPDQTNPPNNHKLLYNPNNPYPTLVILKNIQQMGYFHEQYLHDDGTGQQVYKFFPNYYILDNVEIAHRQKAVLHAMLNQPTDPNIMIEQFCVLARVCYPGSQRDIQQLRNQFMTKQVTAAETLRWYTKETFFYRLLNRLLRAGRDSTELFYAQYFTKLLSRAISTTYHLQRQQKQKEISGSFKCFRGSYFKQQELEELKNNVGKHIETLGFLSTSIEKSVAEEFLLGGNTLVEIDVSAGVPKDEGLDLGYAYLGVEGYSQQCTQKQVLFNVLSSFQIKSVDKFEHKGREFWHIKLEYGVTYQMVHKYKQNKMRQIKGTAEQQQILAILSHQNHFQKYNCQEDCLLHQNGIENFIWMKKTKICLLKSLPQLSQSVELQQFGLYHFLARDQRFRGNQQEFMKEIGQKYHQRLKQEPVNQPIKTQLQNLLNILSSTIQHYNKDNFQEIKLLAKRWRRQKQYLLSSADFQLLACHNPQAIQKLEQMDTLISVYQHVSNIRICDKKGDVQKLKHQIKAAEPLQQQLLTKYDRYHYLYMMLRTCCMVVGYRNGLISYQQYLEFQQQVLTKERGFENNLSNTFRMKLLAVHKSANRYIQCRQWTEAVRVCTEFRNNNYKGRQHQDSECYHPIIVQLNNPNHNLAVILQILQACLSVKHPKSSAFYNKVQTAWTHYKKQQYKFSRLYIQQIQILLTQQPLVILYRLLQVKEDLESVFGTWSMESITNWCLIVNVLKMLGRYEEADVYFCRLKQQISESRHPEYYSQLNLCQ